MARKALSQLSVLGQEGIAPASQRISSPRWTAMPPVHLFPELQLYCFSLFIISFPLHNCTLAAQEEVGKACCQISPLRELENLTNTLGLGVEGYN